MTRLWRLCYTGMGVGYLPDAGGTLDQSVLMMEAFSLMSSVESDIEKRKKK